MATPAARAKAAGTDRAVGKGAVLCFRHRYKVLDRLQAQPRVGIEYERRAADEPDRREILDAVVRDLLEDERIQRVVVVDHHQRVTIGRRLG
jgi:hypothetical protein